MNRTLPFPAGTPLLHAGTSRSRRDSLFAGRSTCKAAAQAFAEPPSTLEMKKPASLYEVLRVRRNASQTEIKSAYRSLAKQYHPDASQAESDNDFIAIHDAYETLADPAARAMYDLSLGSGAGRRVSGLSGMNRSGFHRTWRWETDQCW